MNKWLILVVGILCNAGASALIKVAVSAPRQFPSLTDPMGALRNWPFWTGLSLYGGAFLLYSMSLARLPLNVAHPISTACAIALVACVSVIAFREPMPWTTVAGIALILSGVVLITVHAP
ncbi:DMT family transporter [Stenotrophomonas maltophilia]|uniref:DMT family transporter n=1 Tax=Stenotrophomonas maltophilia TaxID=40324 RepID=UPI00163B5EC8|nr:SMR family transporter [Stenotrophomonas maltophilia]QNG81534.1 multidrug transporter [Stenotrophomonas maltophilia]